MVGQVLMETGDMFRFGSKPAERGSRRWSSGFSLVLFAAAIALGPAVAAAQSAAAAGDEPSSGDPVADARKLALTGHRAEALQRLSVYLDSHATDTDARNLYGVVMSWEGRYDEARAQLQAVLERNPNNTDTLQALINLEMWSGREEAAEALARRALTDNGTTVPMLLSQARALNAMSRVAEAHGVVERALSIEPGNEDALRMNTRLEDRLRHWRASTSFNSSWFSDGRTPWHETQTSIAREGTPVGSMIMRVSHAERFGYNDNQFEVEAYPSIRPGTYAYASVAIAPAAELYPVYRVAGDVYRSLGRGFEGSVGIRRLGFTTPVNIYVTTLTKYRGNWMLTGRAFFVPDQTEGSRSFHASVRRYFSDGETYIGARYGHGFSRQEVLSLNDFVALRSHTVAAEANIVLDRRWNLSVSASTSTEDRAERTALGQESLSVGFSLRF